MRDRGKTLEMYGGDELGSRCRKHPSQASGGICALCLKDKLSKLVCSDCGEQRPPSCSCSEAASSSSNNANNKDKDTSKDAGTVDVGSAGRISFLIESDNVVDLRTTVGGEGAEGQFQCDVKSRPAKPDAIVLLKRSKSIACTTTTPPPSTPPLVAPPPSSLSATAVGDSKVCAPDNTRKKPSSFWSFLYFVKSKPTPAKSNNNKTSDQPKHSVVGFHRSAEQGLVCTKEEMVYRQQELLCNRPTKQRLASRKRREPGLLDFVDEISPRPTKRGVVRRKPTEHRGEGEIPSTHNVYESPLWILPKLFRSRSVGCGRNSFSVDQDGTPPRRVDSGLKTEAQSHMRSYCDEKKPAMTKDKPKQCNYKSPRSAAPSTSTAGHMEIDKEEDQAKARGQSSGKPKGLFGVFGKSGATLYNVSSVVSEVVSQTSGASTGRNKGWSWAFSSPARIFKHSYQRKTARDGFMNQTATLNSANVALCGD